MSWICLFKTFSNEILGFLISTNAITIYLRNVRLRCSWLNKDTGSLPIVTVVLKGQCAKGQVAYRVSRPKSTRSNSGIWDVCGWGFDSRYLIVLSFLLSVQHLLQRSMLQCVHISREYCGGSTSNLIINDERCPIRLIQSCVRNHTVHFAPLACVRAYRSRWTSWALQLRSRMESPTQGQYMECTLSQ